MDKSLNIVTDVETLRAVYPTPLSRATEKVLTRLDHHCQAILALSPFCVISTHGPDGADVSPRGDPPGFVRVLSDTTLLLPDRVGNNRLDGMLNLLENPDIGMLFLVPGMDETLRINGTAVITDDADLLAPSAVDGRAPKLGLVVTIREAFLHCGKAFKRSRLWDPDAQIDRSVLPSYAKMLLDQVESLTEAENERQSEIMAKRGLY